MALVRYIDFFIMSLLNNDMNQFDSRYFISKKFKLNQNFPFYIQRVLNYRQIMSWCNQIVYMILLLVTDIY